MPEKISLKAARINAGLTQEEAAKKIGVDRSTIINWEKNPQSVKAEYQSRIEKAYKYPIDWIRFKA